MSRQGGSSTVTDRHIDRGLPTEMGRDQHDGGHAQNSLLPHPGLMGRHAGCHGRQAFRRDRGTTRRWCGQPEGCCNGHGQGGGGDLLEAPRRQDPDVAGTGKYLCQHHKHYCESPESTRDQPQANPCPSPGTRRDPTARSSAVAIGSSGDWGAGIVLRRWAGGRTGSMVAGSCPGAGVAQGGRRSRQPVAEALDRA
jgi:hypothetical protein